MKKIIPASSIILLLLLSACSSTASATESSDSSASSTLVADLVNQNLTASAPVAPQASPEVETVQLTTDYTDSVSTEMQLLLGSIKLEGTAQAITAEQASVLMPLWTNFKTLNQSMMPTQGDMGQAQTANTEAQTQITELAKQIQASMTPEQINAIVSMQITQKSAQTIIQELGLSVGSQQPGNGNQPPQGDMPQGTPPAGGPGGQPPAGGDQMGTPPDGKQGYIIFISQELMDIFIQLLEQKAGL